MSQWYHLKDLIYQRRITQNVDQDFHPHCRIRVFAVQLIESWVQKSLLTKRKRLY